jgi:heme exporter protein C
MHNLFTPFLLVTTALLTAAHWLIFMVVPNERVMGAVQRVFYVHVGSALACYAALAVVFVVSLSFLARRDKRSDMLCIAAGEVGFVLCTVVLVTGMIWGHSAWNTWFRWEEPRLVTFLVLWLIFLSFTVLRNFGDPSRSATHGAVLGVLGSASVPLVYFSIKLLPQSARLHPEVIEHGGLKAPSYWWGFGVATCAMLALAAVLIWIRYRIGAAEEALRQLSVEQDISLEDSDDT